MENNLVDAVSNLDEQNAYRIVKEKLNSGETPLEIVEQCRQGVETVGDKYSNSVYFLSDLVMSQEIFVNIMKILEPYFIQSAIPNGANIVIGTIEDDIHDIGKNIVVNLLRSVGFSVIDLGVDVKPEQFLKALVETKAKVLGISVTLSFSIKHVKKVIDIIKEAGLRDKVTIVIGGYPVNEKIRTYVGADYYQTNVMNTIELYKKIAL